MNAFICPECGIGCPDQFRLSYHLKLAHRIETQDQSGIEIEEARRRVRSAAIAGAVPGIVTAIFALTGILGYDLWALIDAFLILGLSFGVYKRSRACAVILFTVWVMEKLIQWIEDPVTLMGLPIAVLFGYFFFQGILGTYAYHRLSKISRSKIKIG